MINEYIIKVHQIRMKEHASKHLWYYGSLIIILVMGFSLMLYVAPDKPLRLLVVLMTAFSYVCWALLHHHIHHSLTSKVVLEYVLIASFGLTVSLFLFNV